MHLNQDGPFCPSEPADPIWLGLQEWIFPTFPRRLGPDRGTFFQALHRLSLYQVKVLGARSLDTEGGQGAEWTTP